METCGICLEPIKEENTLTLHCDHVFHPECIDKWTQEKLSCPYCRDTITFPVIKSLRNEVNFIFKITGPLRKRKTMYIEGVPVSGIYTDLLNQAACHIGLNTYYYHALESDREIPCPLFKITIEGKEYLITLYLRLYLIHFNKSYNLNLVKRSALGKKIFMDTTKPFNKLLNAQVFEHFYNFVFEITTNIVSNYQIANDPIIITTLFDIFCVALKKFRLKDNHEMFQLILTCMKYLINELLLKTNNYQFISDLEIDNSQVDTKKIIKWEKFVSEWIIKNLTVFRGVDIYS